MARSARFLLDYWCTCALDHIYILTIAFWIIICIKNPICQQSFISVSIPVQKHFTVQFYIWMMFNISLMLIFLVVCIVSFLCKCHSVQFCLISGTYKSHLLQSILYNYHSVPFWFVWTLYERHSVPFSLHIESKYTVYCIMCNICCIFYFALIRDGPRSMKI
jgi:hypothetical protein